MIQNARTDQRWEAAGRHFCVPNARCVLPHEVDYRNFGCTGTQFLGASRSRRQSGLFVFEDDHNFHQLFGKLAG